jgi:hypothetical protein
MQTFNWIFLTRNLLYRIESESNSEFVCGYEYNQCYIYCYWEFLVGGLEYDLWAILGKILEIIGKRKKITKKSFFFNFLNF